jgi:hypothetical protein
MPSPTFGGIPSEDIAAWQKAVQGIEAGQKDLSSEELSAFQALKNLFNNGNFEASESGGYIKIIKDALPSHSKHRLLQIVHLPNFIKLCEKYFKAKQDAVIEPTPTVVPPKADTQSSVPTFQPPTFQPPVIKQAETKVEPPKVEIPKAEVPKAEAPKIEVPRVENPPLQPEKPKKSNLKLILIVVAGVLLFGSWQIYDNWDFISEKLRINKTTVSDEMIEDEIVSSEIDSVYNMNIDSLHLSNFEEIEIDDISENSIVEESNKIEKANDQQSQKPTTSKPVTASGTVSVTGGTYTGELKSSKPHGMGTIQYKNRTLIDSRDPKKRYAEVGHSITGQFRDGRLLQGKLFDSNGNHIETIIIGGGSY